MKLKGTVIEGVQVGSKFGVATANLKFAEKPDLAEGVYLADVLIEDQKYNGLLHFGELKTFGGGFSAELHILNFEEDIYGKEVIVETLKYLRAVQTFTNSDALFTQIETDICHAEKFFIRRKTKKEWGSVSQKQRSEMATKAIAVISQNEDFLSAKTVFAYAPDDQEIPFVKDLMAAHLEKKWCFPKIENGVMNFYEVGQFADLKPGYLDLLEPTVRTLEFELKPDLIIVPAVAGTLKGQRLGRGGGFYDRFLANNKAKTIGILPEFSIKPALPVEKHDQSVDKILCI